MRMLEVGDRVRIMHTSPLGDQRLNGRTAVIYQIEFFKGHYEIALDNTSTGFYVFRRGHELEFIEKASPEFLLTHAAKAVRELGSKELV